MCPTSLNKMLPQLKEPFPFAYKNLVQTIVPLSAAQWYFEMLCKGLFQVICYNQCPLFFFLFFLQAVIVTERVRRVSLHKWNILRLLVYEWALYFNNWYEKLTISQTYKSWYILVIVFLILFQKSLTRGCWSTQSDCCKSFQITYPKIL